MIFWIRLMACGIMVLNLGCASDGREQNCTSEDKQTNLPTSNNEAGVLIVTASEKYESLMVQTTDNRLEHTIFSDTVDLSSREGILCQNEPKNPDLHYGFQAKSDLSQYFIALYKGNLMKESLEWCRLYAYNPANKSWTQVISFGEVHQPVWKYVEEQNAIVYIDRNSDLLLSHSLEDGTTDTLKEVEIDVRQHAFSTDQGKIQLTYTKDEQVHQLTYNFAEGQLNKRQLASAEQFSSIYHDYMLQVYFTDPGTQGYRLYEADELIAEQAFRVGNVNSFWNKQGQFYLQGENQLFLMNTELDTLGTIALNSPFIYNVLDQYVLAQERSKADKAEAQAYLLSKDLSGKQPTDILNDAAWIVLVRDI